MQYSKKYNKKEQTWTFAAQIWKWKTIQTKNKICLGEIPFFQNKKELYRTEDDKSDLKNCGKTVENYLQKKHKVSAESP